MINESLNPEFYENEVKKYLNTKGDIPPPWVFSPKSHPYSIQWRMGGGESYKMIFSEWFRKHFKSASDRLQFFKKYPAPPRWLGWVAEMVWDIVPLDEDIDYTNYFTKLKMEGFEGVDFYSQDIGDEQWE